MRSRLLNLLRRIGLAFVAIAVATLITLLLWSAHFASLRSVVPILYLGAILTSSWLGGYASGIGSVLFAFCVNVILGREFDLAEIYPIRAVLVLLLSLSVSWMRLAGVGWKLNCARVSSIKHGNCKQPSVIWNTS